MKQKNMFNLTTEDAQRLEGNVRMREGGPVLPLSIEHYFELGDIRDEVVRSWYEYKASCEALSLRELREAIREDLFGMILGRSQFLSISADLKLGLSRSPLKKKNSRSGRPTPKPPKKKLKPVFRKRAEKIEKLSPEAEATYQKLLGDISRTIQETEAKGIPVRHVRHDILECSHCGAYEDVLGGDIKRTTYLGSGEETSKEFQVVQSRERTQDLEGGGVRCTTRYQFICGVCGVFQTQTIHAFFEEP